MNGSIHSIMSNFPDANFSILQYLLTLIKIDVYTCRNRPLSKPRPFQYFQKLPLHTSLYCIQYLIHDHMHKNE